MPSPAGKAAAVHAPASSSSAALHVQLAVLLHREAMMSRRNISLNLGRIGSLVGLSVLVRGAPPPY